MKKKEGNQQQLISKMLTSGIDDQGSKSEDEFTFSIV